MYYKRSFNEMKIIISIYYIYFIDGGYCEFQLFTVRMDSSEVTGIFA